ncbi:MAG: hypothetical protein M0Z61_01475 [Nitrospiraceae bacterium]|nr:hypothetical protein [Nitrospiraceae bacterium]
MQIDVNEYRENYLRAVEERVMAKKDSIPHFSTQGLHDAIMTELNRADEETWKVEVPEDKQQALKEAEERVINWMKENQALGVGPSW